MEIKISKSARNCLGCERDFVHGEALKSIVRIQEGVLFREDYCEACWNGERARDAYSQWIPTFYDPKVAEQEPAEVFSPLRQLFYEAVESEDRLELAKAFLAGQLLRRQKVFKQIKESDESDGEMRLILYADRIGDRLIEVRDPSFSYAELEEARKRLMERLQELEAPESEAEEAETPDDGPALTEEMVDNAQSEAR